MFHPSGHTDATITSPLRQNDIATSFWRTDDVVIARMFHFNNISCWWISTRWGQSEIHAYFTFDNMLIRILIIADSHRVMISILVKYVGRIGHRPRGTHNGSSLHWRHNGHDSVSNHQPDDCLLNCLFRRTSKIISKLRVTGLCVGNSPETGEFPAQMASNAENVPIWWRHHVYRRRILTHLPLVPHICVSELSQRWFR